MIDCPGCNRPVTTEALAVNAEGFVFLLCAACAASKRKTRYRRHLILDRASTRCWLNPERYGARRYNEPWQSYADAMRLGGDELSGRALMAFLDGSRMVGAEP